MYYGNFSPFLAAGDYKMYLMGAQAQDELKSF